MISRFDIRVQFSRTTKSSVTKIKKRYFLDAAIFLASDFFFFVFYCNIATFFIGFTQTEENCVKLIDDDICNKKIKSKAKREIMKRSRNYKKFGKKQWRVSKCKETVVLSDFLYKI